MTVRQALELLEEETGKQFESGNFETHHELNMYIQKLYRFADLYEEGYTKSLAALEYVADQIAHPSEARVMAGDIFIDTLKKIEL